jgi:hypothetical protein
VEDKLVQQVVKDVMEKLNNPVKEETADSKSFINPGMTEFVGISVGDTIGLVIANVDEALHEKMGIDKKFRSIGIIGARTLFI